MRTEEAKELLKNSIEMKDVLLALNINLQGRGNKIRCFVHNDNHPSMKIFRNRVCCFSCQYNEDIFGVTAKFLNLSFPDSVKWLASNFMPGLQLDSHVDHEAIKQAKLQRAIAEGLQIWRNNAYDRLCTLYRATQEAKRKLSPGSVGYFVACQFEGPLDYLTDILIYGKESDWLQVYRQLGEAWGL